MKMFLQNAFPARHPWTTPVIPTLSTWKDGSSDKIAWALLKNPISSPHLKWYLNMEGKASEM